MKKVIYQMLTENTGASALDSGGIYGRNYERNQKKTLKDFENEPAELYWRDGEYIHRQVSVFHYILSMELQETPLCRNFNKRNLKADNFNADADVYGVSSEAWEYLSRNYDVTIERTWNTYNYENDLSQILQGSNLVINDERYLLLQIHGGTDARGGYTTARLFWMPNEYPDGIIDEYKSQNEIQELIKSNAICV